MQAVLFSGLEQLLRSVQIFFTLKLNQNLRNERLSSETILFLNRQSLIPTSQYHQIEKIISSNQNNY